MVSALIRVPDVAGGEGTDPLAPSDADVAGGGAGTVDVDHLRTELRGLLSAYKVPKQILVVSDSQVPIMSSGKLDLRALKDMFGGGGAP